MKNILLSAYAVSPTRGSEYSVGWNYVIELSKSNIVHLVCGVSGEHLGDTVELEDYLKKNPIKNLYLHIVKPNQTINCINWFNKKGFGPAFYIAFKIWQKLVLEEAKVILREYPIDIVHQYNPIGFREPGYLWLLQKPFVWGPIGGANFVNPILLHDKSFKTKILFLLKNFVTYLQLKYSFRVKKAALKASKLIFCCTESMKNFEKFIGKNGVVIAEQAVPEINFNINTINKIGRVLRIAQIGRLNEHKNTRFLLEALSLIKNKKWHLSVIGDGILKDDLIKLSHKLEIEDNITWYGIKTRNEIFDILPSIDLHALTSLSEANTTVLYEARLFGIPTISLDQNGMHDTLSNNQGILVPITSYRQTLQSFADEIELLLDNHDLLEEYKKKTKKLVAKSTWSKKVIQYEEIYNELVEVEC